MSVVYLFLVGGDGGEKNCRKGRRRSRGGDASCSTCDHRRGLLPFEAGESSRTKRVGERFACSGSTPPLGACMTALIRWLARILFA